jgi:adenylyl-sulfate kinase
MLKQQNYTITREQRELKKNQRGLCVWFTGLSGSGKSTLANELEISLYTYGKHTYVLDGDNIRLGINKDLGFSEADRLENCRRVAEVSKLMVDAGIIVLCAFISPSEADRQIVRDILGDDLKLVYVRASLETCINRDVKGLYKKAISGELKNFTGITSPYVEPTDCITIDTNKHSVDFCVSQLIEVLQF